MITDTERLNFVLNFDLKFDERGLDGNHWCVWRMSLNGKSSHFVARGESKRECIDNAIAGNHTRIDAP